jgi:hypothetical protein
VTRFQQSVASNGLPAQELYVLQQIGATAEQIAEVTAATIAADPYVVAAGVPAAVDPMFQPVADFYTVHSQTVAPGGVVLPAVTKPLGGRAVRGTIAIEGRVVHKKEASVWCGCGPTIITQVQIDGQQPPLSSVPYPPGPYCPAPPVPPPQAVPVSLDTTTLPDGAHTVTVLARDSGQCPPMADPREHMNSDSITFYVDNTPPTITVTSQDIEPQTPGIQVTAGDTVAYTAADPLVNGYSSGLVDPGQGAYATADLPGRFTWTLRVADRAGNSGQAQVDVVGPVIPSNYQLHCAAVTCGGAVDWQNVDSAAVVAEPVVGCIASDNYRICFGWTECIYPSLLPPGDCNGDGRMGPDDVGCFVNVLLGAEPDASRVARCDMNDDGTTNGDDIADFVALIIG